MGLAQRKVYYYTLEEYLETEREAFERSEFLDGEIYAMAGESGKHGDISANLIGLFVTELRGKDCRARSKDTKVKSGSLNKKFGKGMISYPDIVVICGEPEYHDKHKDVILNPKVIIFGEARFSYATKGSVREDVREMLSDINRTSKAMVYQIPHIDEKFRMGRNLNDQALLAKARSFHTEATPYEADFIAYGLDANFLNDLDDEITAFENALAAVGQAVDSHVEATAETPVAIRRGMVARNILNGVVKNVYRNNPGKLAAWASASHIEKPKKKETPTPTPA